MSWNSDIEKKIQEALQSEDFASHPGKGKPLKLDENPYEDPGWRLAFHILKSNNFTLPWIERRGEIEKSIEEIRAGLRVAWQERQRQLSLGEPTDDSAGEWERAVEEFNRRVAEVNGHIREYNLQAPSTWFHLFALRPEAEIRQVQE